MYFWYFFIYDITIAAHTSIACISFDRFHIVNPRNTNTPNINTLRPRHNCRHFVDDIFKCIFLNRIVWIRLTFHWKLFLRFELIIFQHWFRKSLDADQATSHYLKQWWLVYWNISASLDVNELKGINIILSHHSSYINLHYLHMQLLNLPRSRSLGVTSLALGQDSPVPVK